jgi:hypothetical protein
MAAKSPAFLVLLSITMTLIFSISSVHGCEPNCYNPPPAVPTPSSGATCPMNTADLGVCVDLLGDLLSIRLNADSSPCCTLLKGLVNADAALCVCAVIKVLNLSVPVDVNVLLNKCGMECPPGFTCPL